MILGTKGICSLANNSISLLNQFRCIFSNAYKHATPVVRSPLRYEHRRNFRSSTTFLAVSRLTPQEVNTILEANEFNKEFNAGSAVKSYDSNQLSSNDPIEDTKTEAISLHNNVFDGHAGGACAQVIAKRLFHYIIASILPRGELEALSQSIQDNREHPLKTLEFYNEKFEFVDVLRNLYLDSYLTFIKDIKETSRHDSSPNMEKVLVDTFLRLDHDISSEAIESEKNVRVNLKTLSVAMSGAVSVVAYIDGPHLHVASVGDCQAVIGVLGENDQWSPKILSVQHNSDNLNEVHRIFKEHPPSEQDSIIKFDRLLGQLAPLRAFGDVRYKWPRSTLEKLAVPHFGANTIPSSYQTPPYLTARPDVTYHRLTPKDKFLVLATDGLWDFISPLQVVRMVGEHMRGKVTLTPFRLPRDNMTLAEINDALLVRKECLSMKPIDKNACTHLIRNALGGTEYGLDDGRLSQLLSLPQDVVRNFRDDISVTVVYFDSEYLRQFLLKQ